MKKILIASGIMAAVGALLFAAEESSPSTTATEHRVFNPTDLKWSETPPGLPPGAKMALLNGDPGKPGAFTVRMNAPAGYTILPHTHPTAERLTVISGSFRIGMGEKFNESSMKELSAGGYVVLPSGMAHFAKSSGESIIQIDSEGPFQINYVNPADDPRNAKK